MRILVLLMCTMIFIACGANLQASEGKLYQWEARASEIDARAQEHPEIGYVFEDGKGKPADVEHACVDTRVAPRGELVIWLMGHKPELFERTSGYGLHSIQVHYANKWFGMIDANDRDGGKALGDIRLEAATGEDFSELVSIPKPDGMMQRATQFVRWLDEKNPEGNWGQFLNSKKDDLIWEKVIVCGSSHGSTTSARFAKHQKVARVVMFSGPRDQYEDWQGLESATPSNRYFGFTHVLDDGWKGDHYCRSWLMLGLNAYGPVVNVDESSVPYENSRRLITKADVGGDAKKAHSSSSPGGGSPKNADGDYLFEPVWEYLLTHPVDQVGVAVSAEGDCDLELQE